MQSLYLVHLALAGYKLRAMKLASVMPLKNEKDGWMILNVALKHIGRKVSGLAETAVELITILRSAGIRKKYIIVPTAFAGILKMI